MQIVWIEDDPRVGALHIGAHGVTKDEVEQVLFEIPPAVEAERSRDHPDRTLFWGATRNDRWIFVVCEDWTEGSVRYLKPITAFEPDEGNDTGGHDEQAEASARRHRAYTQADTT